jgi:hypothetical protein
MENKITYLFKKFDYFGVNMNFHYQGVEKYYSFLGGLIFITYIFLLFLYISINLDSFINRKNINLFYYDKKIITPENLTLDNYSVRFSFGLKCNGLSNSINLSHYLDINLNYISYKINDYGIKIKITKKINSHYCNYSDFFNKYNNSIDENNIKLYFCPDDVSDYINGGYNENFFNYYEINIKSSDNSTNNFNVINNLFNNYECRFESYYIDTLLNYDNFKKPVYTFISSKFLTLKYSKFSKMNIFFKLIKFDDYPNLLFDKSKTKYLVSFSRTEEYEIEKGENRLLNKVLDFNTFAKIYIRADTVTSIIIRKYMKLSEFAANMTSIFSTLLMLLFFLVTCINKHFCKQDIMGKIFQFQNNKQNQTYKTITLLQKKVKFEKIKSGTFIQNEKKDFLFNSVIDDEEAIKISKIKSKNKSKSMTKDMIEKMAFHNKETEKNKNFLYINNPTDNKNLETISEECFNSNINLIKCIKSNHRNISNKIRNGKKNNSGTTIINNMEIKRKLNFEKNKKEESNIKKASIIKNVKNMDLTLPFKICESMIIYICVCCMTKQLKLKKTLYERGQKKLFIQLDILTYLEKINQIELCNNVLMNQKQVKLIHFLSKPNISIYNKSSDIFDELYKNNHYNFLYQNQIDSVFKYYLSLKKKLNKTPYEERLLKIAQIQIDNMLQL